MGFFQHLGKPDGFSLTEVMVGSAVIGGIALGGASLFKEQRKTQARISLDQKLANFHSDLSKTLSIPSNCNATVKSIIGTPSVVPNQAITTLYKCSAGCIDNNAVTLSFDAYTTGAYTPVAWLSVNDYIDTSRTWQISGINLIGRSNSGPITFRLSYRMNTAIGDQQRSVTRDVIIPTRFASGLFRECVNPQESTVNSLQNDLCNGLNLTESGISGTSGNLARWDETTQTCVIDGVKDCQSGGQLVNGISTDGIVRCRNITSNTDAANLASNSPTVCSGATPRAQAYYDTVTKKFRIRCVP
jgi:prepilin-type N-terminal cleavage/methylation domain-containing protein